MFREMTTGVELDLVMNHISRTSNLHSYMIRGTIRQGHDNRCNSLRDQIYTRPMGKQPILLKINNNFAHQPF